MTIAFDYTFVYGTQNAYSFYNYLNIALRNSSNSSFESWRLNDASSGITMHMEVGLTSGQSIQFTLNAYSQTLSAEISNITYTLA